MPRYNSVCTLYSKCMDMIKNDFELQILNFKISFTW